jgi:creatinine amidohydrolase
MNREERGGGEDRAWRSYDDGRYTYRRLLAHADYFETPCMLYVNPDLVRMDHATPKQDFDSFWDYRTDQVSASGIWGRDIPEANAENGEHEITRCVGTMACAVAAGIKEPFPRPE